MLDNNSTVLLTGATGLIGKMLTETLLAHGYTVVFTSSNIDNINALYNQFNEYESKERLIGLEIDFLSEDYLGKISQALAEKNIRPNYLINNARTLKFLNVDDFKNIHSEQWAGEYFLDVIVPYQLSVLLAEQQNRELKAIVNISSMYAILAYNDYLADGKKNIAINYGVAKAALVKLTKELAVRFADNNIRVNAISYGGVEGRADASFKERYAKICPARKMLTQEEITGHVLYLCSDMSLGMTGQNIVVDGGISLW